MLKAPTESLTASRDVEPLRRMTAPPTATPVWRSATVPTSPAESEGSWSGVGSEGRGPFRTVDTVSHDCIGTIV